MPDGNGLNPEAPAINQDGLAERYGESLTFYLKSHDEEALYHASLLSQAFIESGIGPDEIIGIHFEALEKSLAGVTHREQARMIPDAHQFLLEIMVAYGVRYKEYLELRVRDSLREAEARASVDRQRALEAVEAEREKTEILAMIAHELRTPLTAASGNVVGALRFLSRGQVDTVPRLLDSAREALERLSRLTADLMEASRGQVARLERVPLRLDAVVAQACTWVRAAAGAKDIALVYECDAPEVQVSGNPDALLSLFGNLLSNAVRYTPPGGRVTVQLRADSALATVEIADTGIGMSPEVQARVFERFYRGPEARSIEAQGLGLGLSLAHQMAVAHDGHIAVESTLGQGSTFRVVLPCFKDVIAEGDAHGG